MKYRGLGVVVGVRKGAVGGSWVRRRAGRVKRGGCLTPHEL